MGGIFGGSPCTIQKRKACTIPPKKNLIQELGWKGGCFTICSGGGYIYSEAGWVGINMHTKWWVSRRRRSGCRVDATDKEGVDPVKGGRVESTAVNSV